MLHHLAPVPGLIFFFFFTRVKVTTLDVEPNLGEGYSNEASLTQMSFGRFRLKRRVLNYVHDPQLSSGSTK